MFGYVILHYQNIDITRKCVLLIQNLFPKSIIVIVDNCSPNGSGLLLKNEYSACGNISVVLNKKNEGFAKGNNLGFAFLKENFDADYIVVMNNDILINDSEFERRISSFMVKNHVDVCGPDMVTPNGNHQNPLGTSPLSNAYLKRRIFIDRIKTTLLKGRFFYNLYLKYKKNKPLKPRTKQVETFDCILHGSCVVYGKKYIENECLAFLPITFMYNEEYILYDYLKYRGYKTGYCEDISIEHMEGISTATSIDDSQKKLIFRFSHNTESLKKQIIERKKYSR